MSMLKRTPIKVEVNASKSVLKRCVKEDKEGKFSS